MRRKSSERRILSRYPLTVVASATALTALMVLMALFLNSAPTGHMTEPTMDVSVKEEFAGAITAFSYIHPLDISDKQIIVTEFTNIGNVPFDEQMTVTVYYYNRTLIERAKYEDGSFSLNPGMRRGYRNEFIPLQTGDYYIKLRVAYQYKVALAWGYFSVYLPSDEGDYNYSDENYTIIYNYTYEPPITLEPISVPVLTNPNMSFEYNDSISVAKGEKILVPVKLRNNGDVPLTKVKIYLSAPYLLYTDINPKEVAFIAPGDYYTFLISMEPGTNMETGNYSLMFEALSAETNKRANMSVIVTEESEYENWQKMKDLILSYSYISSDLHAKISYLASYGADVRDVNATLSQADDALDSARSYFDQRNYQECKSALSTAGQFLESASLQIGHLTLKLYAYQPQIPYITIAFVILIILVAIYLIYRHEKKKDQKPKFLEKAENPE